MKATRGQVIMLLELWHEATTAIHIQGDSDRERRLNWSEQVIGRRVESWNDLNRRSDVDLLKARLLAILRPADLNAQLNQLRQARKRAEYRLRQLMAELEVGWNYVAEIVHTMNVEGKLGSNDIDELDARELTKVVIALEQQARRRSKRVYHLHAA